KSLGFTRKEREEFLNQVIEELKQILRKYNLDAGVQGRVKHIYSIYKKFKNKGYQDINDLYDITAVRVITNNIDECYKVLAEVNNLYSPIPEEFSDYIANPKPNGYKSIHTVVRVGEQNIEVQIRTHKMHEESELGFAAHWRYKEGVKFDASYEARVAWLRSLLEWEKEINEDDSQITKELNKRLYVFTPANELIDLAEDSTVLDFAYSVHTMVGHRTKGVKLNGKIVPLTTKLKTGDKVEVLTGKEPNPSKDWASESLGYLTSARNRSRVTKWFNEQNKEDNIVLGKDRLLKELRGYDLKEVDFVEVVNKFNMKSSDSLFVAVENGTVRINSIVNHILDTYSAEEKLVKKQNRVTTAKAKTPKVLVSGFNGMKYEMAKCCQPVYPDEIQGYMSVSKGVVIHTSNCPNLSHLKEKSPEKFIEVNWDE
ncbi:RelA/SpoT family protein, partial [Francisella orientalis]